MPKLLSLYTLLFSLVLSNASMANVRQLAKEYLQRNAGVRHADLEREIIRLEDKVWTQQFQWKIKGQGQLLENELDAPTNVNFNAGTAWQQSVGLHKSTLWGGQFSLEFGRAEVDQNRTLITAFGGQPTVYQFHKFIQYEQDLGKDFFGRRSRIEEKSNMLAEKVADAQYDEQREKLLFDFYQAYLSVVMMQDKMQLQQEVLDNANERLELVKKMLKDGQARKVDLTQAKAARAAANESVHQANFDWQEHKNNLEIMLERRLSKNEVSQIKNLNIFSANQKMMKRYEDIIDGSPRFRALQEKVEIKAVQIDKAQRESLPDISLAVKYKTNNYDATQSEAIKGISSQEYSEKIFLLSLEIPLDREANQAKKEQAILAKAMAESELRFEREKTKQEMDSLYFRLEQVKKSLTLVKEALEMSKQAHNEYKTLYRSGKVTFDLVISSEEEWIGTRRRQVVYLYQRELLEARMASLAGELEKSLNVSDKIP